MSQSDSVSSPVLSTAVLSGSIGSVEVRNLRSRNRFEAIDRSSLASREEALVVDDVRNCGRPRWSRASSRECSRMLPCPSATFR